MVTVGAIADHKYEAHCECGASWWLFAPDDPEPENVECLACGATVVDLREPRRVPLRRARRSAVDAKDDRRDASELVLVDARRRALNRAYGRARRQASVWALRSSKAPSARSFDTRPGSM